ncbi:MAG: hypothetical protein AAFS10_20195 [Myxococcota bacterium]
MPRPLTAHDPLDHVEDELNFTLSALNSDPHGSAFAPLTETWLPRLETVRKADRVVRRRVVTTDARRIIANENLDDACEAFGAALFEAVGEDDRAERWTRLFKVPVHTFVRQAFRTQVAMVQAWLDSDEEEPVLEEHRPLLEHWVKAATVSLEDARALAVQRAENTMRREHLTEDLNRERDALYSALVQYARDHELPATWPEAFFRKSAHVWI